MIDVERTMPENCTHQTRDAFGRCVACGYPSLMSTVVAVTHRKDETDPLSQASVIQRVRAMDTPRSLPIVSQAGA